jgi:hypothetical protein
MQTNHHRTVITRVKVYHGRSHTKKQPHSEAYRQSVSLKKAIKQIRRVGQKPHSKIIYTHFTHSEKPPQYCRKRTCHRKQKPNSGINKKANQSAFSKASPFGGGLEGASSFWGDLEEASPFGTTERSEGWERRSLEGAVFIHHINQSP